MNISRVIVYVGVVTGVCGLKLNSGKTLPDGLMAVATQPSFTREGDSLIVFGPDVDTLLKTYTELGTVVHLVVVDKYFTNVSALSGLKSLQMLDLSDTGVTDISALSGLDSLESLYLSGTGVTNISFLKQNKREILPDLTTLDLSTTCVRDISALSGRELEMLDLTNTPVDEFTGLEKVIKLYVSETENPESKASLKGYTLPMSKVQLDAKHLLACAKEALKRK